MRKLTHMLLAGTLILACSSCGVETTANYQVIPLPQEVALSQESPFNLNDGTIIAYPEHNELLKRNAEFLAEYISQSTGHTLQTEALAPGSEAPKGAITLGLDPAIGNREGYVLTVKADRVTLNGQTENGVFYGIQTLRKSIPAETKATSILLPAGSIQDEPRFSYRGMHLDVGRHFFPIEFVKKYIDLLALHNMNTFHWHLTEDQGWRIEIKKYPKLTEIGAWRDRTVIGRNTEEYDNTRYGGFYTQEQAKEIVKYAGERYITVIPEVDLPGHMLAALAAYPEMGCTGGPYEVCPRWGVFEDVLCIGNEKSMQFLEDVMAEIIDIFPSKYIHIGGDEAPRTRWEKCPKCQARIRTEKLKADKNHTAEDRLQSYCMTRIEKLLNSKGRQIIGWDEILEGGLAPNATVMSWRGESGGIEAARQKHNVIMTPNTYLYFDYYQAKDTETEPLAIGGYLPMERVYSYEPMPSALTPEEQKYITGVQANLWTEYIPTFAQAQYMVLPRMAALCETQWSAPDKKKDYEGFLKRTVRLMDIYKLKGWNYATHILDVKVNIAPNQETGKLDVSAYTVDNAPIYYTLDGTEPTAASLKYEDGLSIDQACVLRMTAVRPEGNSRITCDTISFSKSTAKPISMLQPINKAYEFNGAPTLVDGMTGNRNYKTGHWIAFYKNDMEAVIDLKEATEISSMTLRACVEKGDWIFDARGISVEVSDDNKAFKQVASESYPAMKETDPNQIYVHTLNFTPVKTRYVKVKALSEKSIPAWHGGKGNPGYLFVDEIILN